MDFAWPTLRTIIAGTCLALGLFAWSMDASAQSLRCEFSEGQTWTYQKGAFGMAESGKLSFEITKIDPEHQLAELRTKNGTSDLRLVQALDARHYIEVTVAGFLNITTVYDRETKGADSWLAVHSRHLGIVGQPVVSQYRGVCRMSG